MASYSWWPIAYNWWPSPPTTPATQVGLSAAELAAMRSVADGYLPDLCTIQRATQGQDDLGGVTLTWATLVTDVACRMDEPKIGGAEQPIDLAPGSAVKRIMHFAYSQDITVKDRVIYGGLTYEVSEVLEAASWLISRRVVLMRIE